MSFLRPLSETILDLADGAPFCHEATASKAKL